MFKSKIVTCCLALTLIMSNQVLADTSVEKTKGESVETYVEKTKEDTQKTEDNELESEDEYENKDNNSKEHNDDDDKDNKEKWEKKDSDSETEDDNEYEKYEKEYLGNFKLTAYCNCAQCCGSAGQPTASGVMPTEGRTVAMGDIDFGTKLLINGNVYTVEDRGVPYGHVDIYFESHSTCLDFGVQYADVYLLKEKERE